MWSLREVQGAAWLFFRRLAKFRKGHGVRSEGDFPSGLVDDKEGEKDYYDLRLQLNEQP
jgi:hypothetical protein